MNMQSPSRSSTARLRPPSLPASPRSSAKNTPSPIAQAQEPYLVEMRDLFQGHTPVVLRPGSVEEVATILTLANDTANADRAAGRQYRPGRRADPAARRDRALAQSPRPHPRGRCDLEHDDLRGRRHACSARARLRPTPTGSIRSCCPRRAPAPSAAISPPMPAAPRRSPTASPARTRSASKSCSPTAACSTTSTS